MIFKIEKIIENEKEYKVTTWNNGNQFWSINGNLHREKGPSVIRVYGYKGYKAWHQNGRYQRLGGPARIWSNGRKEWYINGKKVSKYQHDKVRTMIVLGLDKI
jgi:hypothetical protein